MRLDNEVSNTIGRWKDVRAKDVRLSVIIYIFLELQ